MQMDISYHRQSHPFDVRFIAARIAAEQRENGEIPWRRGEKTDPWDMVEAAMGLSIGGYRREAEHAYQWLADLQNADGSWFTAYRDGQPEDKTRDANLSSYCAVGIYHHFLTVDRRSFLKRMWATLEAAIDFALGLQSPHGDIYWAVNPRGEIDRMALLTGSSSIFMSIKCALAVAGRLGIRKPSWERSLHRLKHAILYKPHRFNMTKSRYAMDWYYPVLCGAMTGVAARCRIERFWKRFVLESEGVRCVYDAPWVTIAETAELCLALTATGNRSQAEIVFNWISDKKYDDGAYWAGFTFPDMTVWPEGALTWTNGVVLMAADALYGFTPAAGLFSHGFWQKAGL